MTLPISEDILLEWADMVDAGSSAYINTATVNGYIYAMNSTTILASCVLQNVSSNGLYQGTIHSTDITLTEGKPYIVELVATTTTFLNGLRRQKHFARYSDY